MAWFEIEVSDAENERARDEIEAFQESEARFLIQNLGYELHSIRKLHLKSFFSKLRQIIYRCLFMEDYMIRRKVRKILESSDSNDG